MPGIAGMATTFNYPNFVGPLFQVSPEDTPFLSAIGGLTGGREANGAVLFTWAMEDLRDADDARQRLEGATPPAAEGRVPTPAFNVLEIHQEQVNISYTAQAATGQITPIAGAQYVPMGNQPVMDKLTHQLTTELRHIARDVNKSFITGTFQFPTDNATPRKTRGLLSAIATNVVVNGSPAALTETMVLDLMQTVWEAGGIQVGETRTILTGAKQKRALTKIFVTDKNYREQTRNVGGVSLQSIETDFGLCNIMLDRNMPANTLAVVSLEDCAPRFLNIPGKGHFFAEPLAKTGSSEPWQLYGEIGLEYGNEKKHGKITNLS